LKAELKYKLPPSLVLHAAGLLMDSRHWPSLPERR